MDGDGGVVGGEGGLVNGEGALEVLAGALQVAQGLQHAAQVVDRCGDGGVVWAEDGLVDAQGVLEAGAGLGVGGHVVQVVAQTVPQAAGGGGREVPRPGRGGPEVGQQGGISGIVAGAVHLVVGLHGQVGQGLQEGFGPGLPAGPALQQPAGELGQQGVHGRAALAGLPQGQVHQLVHRLPQGLRGLHRPLQDGGGDGFVGGQQAGQQEEAAGRRAPHPLPGEGKRGPQAQVVVGGVAPFRLPAPHGTVVEEVLQARQVVGHAQVGLGGQVAGGQLQGQGQVAQARGQGVQVGVGGPLRRQGAAQEGAALGWGEGGQGPHLHPQVVGPVAPAGGDEQAQVGVAQAAQGLAGGRQVFQVVQHHQSRPLGLPSPQHAAGELVAPFALGLAQAQGLAVAGDLLVQLGGVAQVEPVDAAEAVAVAVGELHGQLGLAYAAQAGHGLGDHHRRGLIPLGRAEGRGQGAQLRLAAGEGRVAAKGQGGAGRQRAGQGDLFRQGPRPRGGQGHGVPVADDDYAAAHVAVDQHLAAPQGLLQGGGLRRGQRPARLQARQDVVQAAQGLGEAGPLLGAHLLHHLQGDRHGVVAQAADGQLQRLGVEAGALGALRFRQVGQVAVEGGPQGALQAAQVEGPRQGGQLRLHGGQVAEGQVAEDPAQVLVGAVPGVLEPAVGRFGGPLQAPLGLFALEPGLQASLHLRADERLGHHPGGLVAQPGPGLVLEQRRQQAQGGLLESHWEPPGRASSHHAVGAPRRAGVAGPPTPLIGHG